MLKTCLYRFCSNILKMARLMKWHTHKHPDKMNSVNFVQEKNDPFIVYLFIVYRYLLFIYLFIYSLYA